MIHYIKAKHVFIIMHYTTLYYNSYGGLTTISPTMINIANGVTFNIMFDIHVFFLNS